MQEPRDASMRSGRRSVRCESVSAQLGALLVALVLTVLAVDLVRVQPLNHTAESKLADLAREPADHEMVFIGDSRVFQHVQPLVVDRVLAEQGVSIRSYNFGLGGMVAGEAHFLMRKIIGVGAKVRIVVIDLAMLRRSESRPEGTSKRFRYWHDARATSFMLGEQWKRQGLAHESLPGFVRDHVMAFLYHLGNVGAALEYFEGESDPGVNTHAAGYISAEEIWSRVGSPEQLAEQRRGWEERKDWYRDVYRKFLSLEQRGKLRKTRSGIIRSFDRQVSALIAPLEAVGIKVMFMFNVNGKKVHFANDGRKTIAGNPVIAMDSYERYPVLYDPDMRRDYAHLNHEGAAIFSRELALRLAPFLSE